jgi:uncharacterized membrane protein YoaK (UPF0700 family)
MPIHYLSDLTALQRNSRTNLHLGVSLAFVAGALNAGGFLAIGQYTSHMTGIVSSTADNLVLGNGALAAAGVLSLASFMIGAASTAVLVNYAKRNGRAGVYTTPLFLEAFLLLVFGMVGATLRLHEIVSVSLTAILLCYVMGLQNALITKVSNAEIRTTHVTGLVTDLGIELGKLFYWNRIDHPESPPEVVANRRKLLVHAFLVAAFFIGGLIGALGFKYIGFSSTIPLAFILVVIALAPRIRQAAQLRRADHATDNIDASH